ncbi:hypothetical protein LSCM1_06062 [Leishmania martiniquensis]|uniref:Uncharacterized protein n=1 Tax=Leishmania martiniquensis TaxID=1580590 RepID=A0A836KUH3_9TRYP|nr:hypothetical protein LSCM1_06062 [Leishmania martiniquensis]
MDDSSFLSGLSSIHEAIGDAANGRCISIFVTRCEPSLDELAVRLGGPGCPWEITPLPMQRPVVLYRHPGVRVACRATELAFATKAYAESAAADASDVHPSGCMVAMDILTSTAINAAASTLTASGAPAETTGVSVLELSAAKEVLDGTPDAEYSRGASQPPLRVCFRWAAGEVLPGVTPPARGVATAGEGNSAEDERKAHASDDETCENEDGRQGDTPLPHTSAPPGDEAIPPSSHGKLSTASSPSQLTFAGFHAVAEENVGGATAAAEGVSARAAPAHDNASGEGTATPINGAMTAVSDQERHDSSNGLVTRDEVPVSSALPTEMRADTAHEEKAVPELGGDGEEAAAVVSARLPSPFVVHPLSAPDAGVISASTGRANNDADRSRPLALKIDALSAASASILDASSSPLRSKTPRRRRPHHYRGSTIHMAVAPVMTPPLPEADGRDATAENPVQVSEDDDENADNAGAAVLCRPPLPPLIDTLRQQVGHSAPHEVVQALDSDISTPVRLSKGAESSYNSAAKLPPPNGAADDTLDRQRHAAPVSEEPHGTSVVVKAPAVPQPTAANLFKGADGAAFIVVLGVVAIYNANGIADPHRIVSAEISATTVEEECPAHDPALGTTAFSFRTAPALRGLTAVVPQVSIPALLLPRCENGAKGAAGDSAGVADGVSAVPPPLHAHCIVTEHMTFTEGGASGDCASATLWTSTADVALGHGLPLPSASSPAPAPPITHEVRFTGPNGDVVLTLWTYMTVSAYRDAVLNLRSRVTARGAPPVLQLLLVEESPIRVGRQRASRRRKPSAATLWVSSPCSSDSERVDSIAYRVVAVSPAYDVVQQPVSVPLRDPLVYVAVQLSSCSSAASHAQLIFSYMFSDAWTRSTAVACDGDTRAASLSVTAALYYRFVDASSAAASAELSSLPTPRRKGSGALHDGNAAAELREVIITVRPPTTFLRPLSSSASSHASPGKFDAALHSASSWHLVLCHAATRAILAEASPETGVLSYRSFLPVRRGGRQASGERGVVGTAITVTPSVGEVDCLPWEVLMVPSTTAPSKDCRASLQSIRSTEAMRSMIRSPARTTRTNRDSGLASQRVAKTAGTNVWSGAMWISCSALYSAPSTGARWKTSMFVSSAPAPLTATISVLRSPPAALGAQLELMCAVRSHVLGADSAVFRLRSLRIVPSALASATQTPPESASPLPPSQVQLWFTTSGSSAEEVRAVWSSAHVPSAKELQRAWAPAVPESSSSCTPPLRVGADGQLACPSAPVLLSTTNARARLCVALASAAETTASADGMANARALRRCVETVRKGAMRRYKKAHASTSAEHESSETAHQQQAQAQLTEGQMADVFLHCINAVAMDVENYAEVDLTPSLVAASERPGKTRHRLLLSSVSGTIRMSRRLVLELQGQWIKMPRWVPIVSECYTPSPRLWALRRSCIVRHLDPPLRAACSRIGVSEGGQLAQEVLEAHMGYDVVVQSVPLDYTDPSERTVEKLLPGLSYNTLVMQKNQREARLQPYCEVIRIASSEPAAASRRRGIHAALVAGGVASNDDKMIFKDSEELLEHIFGPTGLAHTVYVPEASHKVAAVHFFFGDAYTTRTVLNVSCTASAADKGVMTSVPAQPCSNGGSPQPLFPGEPTQATQKSTTGRSVSSSSTMQIFCDSLTRTSTFYDGLPVSDAAGRFPGESRYRYPSELTWYHGNLTIEAEEEKRRREEGEAAWIYGLTEQQLGAHQKPGPLVVSAITQHPRDCLPLVVEPSLTRCADGRHYIVFGGFSTVTGAASSGVYAFDGAEQVWKPLRARRSACGTVLSSTPAAVPPPRYGHTAVYRLADGAIYVFGGRGRHDDTSAAPVYGDVWRMFWNTSMCTVAATELHCTWADAPSAAAEGREKHMPSTLIGDCEGEVARWRHAAVLHNDYIVVIGGQSSTGECCSCARILYLDLTTQEWTARRSFGTEVPCPRYGLAATVASDGTALYIFGGWRHEQSEAGKLLSAAHSSSPSSSDANGGTEDADEDQGAVALSDFFKMDLITRVWSRVEPNGTVRPPALELADMTSCILDNCPVILLVGGRTNGGVVATPTTERTAAAQLMVFLFSTATLFWRMVRMDCSPVAARFGLRAVATARPTKASRSEGNLWNAQQMDSSSLRRALPPRGRRIGSILVVGGLPLEEVDVAQTAPAISILLAAGNGSFTASRCATTASDRVRGRLHSQQGHLTPWPPSVPRATAMRRPMIGPERTVSRKPHSLASGSRRVPIAASVWLQTSQSTHVGGDGDYEPDGSAVALAEPGTSSVSTRQSMERLRTPASASGQSATPLGPQCLSCYSTLTPWQQRKLVRRLYTEGVEIRAAHHQQLQAALQQELAPFDFRFSRNRKRSPGARRSPIPARRFSTRLPHPPYDAATTVGETTTLDTIKINKSSGSLICGGAIAGVPLAHRDSQNTFLVCSSSSSSSRTSSLTISTSRSSSSIPSSSDSEGRAEVVEPQRAGAFWAAPSGGHDRTDNSCAEDIKKADVSVAVPEAEKASAATTGGKASATSESGEGLDDHFEGSPVPISMPVTVLVAATENRKERVAEVVDDAPVAAPGAPQAKEVDPAVEVGKDEPHKMEQQAPDAPALPPPGSLSSTSAASSKSISRPSTPPMVPATNDNADAEGEAAAAAPLSFADGIPAADHQDEMDKGDAGDGPEEEAAVTSSASASAHQQAGRLHAALVESEVDDDWEVDSDMPAHAAAAAGVPPPSASWARASAPMLPGADELLGDLIPPPAPREHATPPSSPSVLPSPLSEETRSAQAVTEHGLSNDKATKEAQEAQAAVEAAVKSLEAATALPVSLPAGGGAGPARSRTGSDAHQWDVAEKPFGVLSEADMSSSPASSMADNPAGASLALRAPAAPVSPLQRSHADENDKSSKAPSSPPVEASLGELQHDADAAVEQLFTTPPAFFSNGEGSTQGLEGAPPQTTATPPQRAIEPALAASADIGEGGAVADAAVAPDQRPTAPSATPRNLSNVLEALPAVPSSHASSIASDYMDNGDATTASSFAHEGEKSGDTSASAALLTEGASAAFIPAPQQAPVIPGSADEDGALLSYRHEEPLEEEAMANVAPVEADLPPRPSVDVAVLMDEEEKAAVQTEEGEGDEQDDASVVEALSAEGGEADANHEKGDAAGLPGTGSEGCGAQDDAEKGILTAAAAEAVEEAFEQSSAAGMVPPHVEESMEEEPEEAPSASEELPKAEGTAAAEQVGSASTRPPHTGAPDNWSELSCVEEDALAKFSADTKDDAVYPRGEANAGDLCTPAVAAPRNWDERMPATEADALTPQQAAAEHASDGDGTQASSGERAGGTIVDPNDGRDLLDRRRGVEGALKDDDFDF